jgi:hypothetical protein
MNELEFSSQEINIPQINVFPIPLSFVFSFLFLFSMKERYISEIT